MKEPKWQSLMADTPIGKLFTKGFTDQQIAHITDCHISAVNKWRLGVNKANYVNQAKVAGYLKALNEITEPVKEQVQLQDRLFMINVPYQGLDRFNKVMIMLGLIAVDMDQT